MVAKVVQKADIKHVTLLIHTEDLLHSSLNFLQVRVGGVTNHIWIDLMQFYRVDFLIDLFS